MKNSQNIEEQNILNNDNNINLNRINNNVNNPGHNLLNKVLLPKTDANNNINIIPKKSNVMGDGDFEMK